MYKVPVALILAGFLVVFLSLPLLGTDLLIDAVGFLLIFNGLLPLQKQTHLFALAPATSLALVIVASAQLFAGGWFAGLLAILRFILQTALYIQMLRGFALMARQKSALGFWRTAWVVLGVCLFALAVQVLYTCGLLHIPLLYTVFAWVEAAVLSLWLVFLFVKTDSLQ